ncbi:MAG: FHA domain-containing protein [Myxococcales bacterium]|nr:FHA domain-containing protein [Myxococcales bacterium]
MIPALGKSTLSIGSHPSCDIVLEGAGVAPEHARLVHQGGGRLELVQGTAGMTTVAGRSVAPGASEPFDFRQQFRLGDVPLPLDHPQIVACLMATGQLAPVPGRIVIGRDLAQAHLALQHPSISSLHCTISLERMMVTDHDSTSGTYVGGQRIASSQPVPLPEVGNMYLGPVPLPISLLKQLAAGLSGSAAQPAAQPAAQSYATPAQALAATAAASLAQQDAIVPRKHKTVFGQLDFSAGGKTVRSIGRTPDNDIPITHPQVSSHHAEIAQIDGRLFVTDRGSANGTFVRGHRIAPHQRIEIASGEKIYVGPMPLQLVINASGIVDVVNEAVAEARWAGRPLFDIEAWQLQLEVPDRDNKSRMKVLLDNISFKALPGDMIALMGPSGAGKTTLLLALNGYLPPSNGLVRINGEDLYSIYDLLRGSIGYVPQDDLVHAELTVSEAVRFSAKFRLPPDFSNEEIEARVTQTLRDLGLDSVAHLEIGTPEKKILSGGQRKRVNIALELVTDPVVLYLDEPTSGLAADDAASLILLLSELAKATGKTIIMTIHQPDKEEYEKFTHALLLGYGGVPMYFGPTVPESYQFFSGFERRRGAYLEPTASELVDNPRDLFGNIAAREVPIHKQLLAQNPNATRATARNQAAQLWRQEFFADTNPVYKRMYSGRRSIGTEEGQRGMADTRPVTRGQFWLLFLRYFKTKVRDVSGTLIMLLQAPIIGVLLAVVFGGQADATPGWCLGALHELSRRTQEKAAGASFDSLATTQDHTGAMFFLVVSAVWFGTSNAAREIVRERSIYLRERMVNLGIFNYVMSKFALLSVFCVIQCTCLLGIVFVTLGFHGGANAFFIELGALVATSITAVALGLLLSTLVGSSEAAMALTPIALIPQVVLGGLMVPATTIPKLSPMMYSMPARWGFEAAVVTERLAIAKDPAWLIDLGSPDKSSAADFIKRGKFECATAQMASDSLNGAWAFTTYDQTYLPFAALGGMTLLLLITILVTLKRRDRI